MEFKGTKGPWSLRNEFDEKYDQPIINVDSENGSEESFATIWSGLCLESELDEKTKANAQLISKAPEMLHTLKDVFKALDCVEKDSEGNCTQTFGKSFVDKIQQLIKSATEIK